MKVLFTGKQYEISDSLILLTEKLNLFSTYSNRLLLLLVEQSKAGDFVGAADEDFIAWEKPIREIAKEIIVDAASYNVYDITVRELVDDNPGYKELRQVCSNTMRKKVDTLLRAVDEDINNLTRQEQIARSKVTGSGVSIWTNSLASALLYSFMESSVISGQTAQAEREFHENISKLALETQRKHDKEQYQVLIDVYYPGCRGAINTIVENMLKTYLVKMDKEGVLNYSETQRYDFAASEALLQNISLVPDKIKLLRTTFEKCPYNPDIYNELINLDEVDYDTFETAWRLNQGKKLLPFILEYAERSIKQSKNTEDIVRIYALCAGISEKEAIQIIYREKCETVFELYGKAVAASVNEHDCIQWVSENISNNRLELIQNKKQIRQKIEEKIYAITDEEFYSLLSKTGIIDSDLEYTKYNDELVAAIADNSAEILKRVEKNTALLDDEIHLIDEAISEAMVEYDKLDKSFSSIIDGLNYEQYSHNGIVGYSRKRELQTKLRQIEEEKEEASEENKEFISEMNNRKTALVKEKSGPINDSVLEEYTIKPVQKISNDKYKKILEERIVTSENVEHENETSSNRVEEVSIVSVKGLNAFRVRTIIIMAVFWVMCVCIFVRKSDVSLVVSGVLYTTALLFGMLKFEKRGGRLAYFVSSLHLIYLTCLLFMMFMAIYDGGVENLFGYNLLRIVILCISIIVCVWNYYYATKAWLGVRKSSVILLLLLLAACEWFFIDTLYYKVRLTSVNGLNKDFLEGDRLFADKYIYDLLRPQRYDLILFNDKNSNESQRISRIIGLPGETVRIENGKVFIDGGLYPLEDRFCINLSDDSFGPELVPDNSYFVLSDNRQSENDSRYWKEPFVYIQSIRGKCVCRFLPLERIALIESINTTDNSETTEGTLYINIKPGVYTFHDSPDSESKGRLVAVKDGYEIEVLKDSTSEWYHIKVNETSGYVRPSQLAGLEFDSRNNDENEDGINSETIESTERIRIEPGPYIVHDLPDLKSKGHTIIVGESEEIEVLNDSTNLWYHTTINGTTGYVYSSQFANLNSINHSTGKKEDETISKVSEIVSNIQVNPGTYFLYDLPKDKSKGHTVTIMREKEIDVLSDSTSEWYHVSINGKTGYIRSTEIQGLDRADGNGTTSQTTAISGQSSADNTLVQDLTVESVGRVTSKQLKLRSKPDYESDVVGTLSQGQMVEIYNDGKGDWYHINADGMNGYAVSFYIEIDAASAVSMVKDIEEKTASPEVSIATEKEQNLTDSESPQVVDEAENLNLVIEAIGRVTSKQLKLRSKPDYESDVVGTLSQGQLVEIYNDGEGDWYHIHVDGKSGFAVSFYIDRIVDGFVDIMSEAKKENALVEQEKAKKVQQLLSDIGINCGEIDGIVGDKTIYAILDFQAKQNDEPIDGIIDDELISRLEDELNDGNEASASGSNQVKTNNKTTTKQNGSTSVSFTNKYGTPTTICAHLGCNNYIATSGDTNCCIVHSNRCHECGKYIDEDALYCTSCLTKAINSASANASGSGNKSSGYGYNPNDPYYSANDHNKDGKINDEEFQDAFNAAIDDLIKEMGY